MSQEDESVVLFIRLTTKSLVNFSHCKILLCGKTGK